MILFKSHDNDFTDCLRIVVEWLVWRVGSSHEAQTITWLLTEDAVDTLSEAFAATVYARSHSDVAVHIDKGGCRWKDRTVTLDDRRAYLGKVKISLIEELDPDGYDGEAVVWDGQDVRIV